MGEGPTTKQIKLILSPMPTCPPRADGTVAPEGVFCVSLPTSTDESWLQGSGFFVRGGSFGVFAPPSGRIDMLRGIVVNPWAERLQWDPHPGDAHQNEPQQSVTQQTDPKHNGNSEQGDPKLSEQDVPGPEQGDQSDRKHSDTYLIVPFSSDASDDVRDANQENQTDRKSDHQSDQKTAGDSDGSRSAATATPHTVFTVVDLRHPATRSWLLAALADSRRSKSDELGFLGRDYSQATFDFQKRKEAVNKFRFTVEPPWPLFSPETSQVLDTPTTDSLRSAPTSSAPSLPTVTPESPAGAPPSTAATPLLTWVLATLLALSLVAVLCLSLLLAIQRTQRSLRGTTGGNQLAELPRPRDEDNLLAVQQRPPVGVRPLSFSDQNGVSSM